MTSTNFCAFSISKICIDSHTFWVCKIGIQHAISMDWEHSSMTATSKGDPLLLLATSADVFLAARCLRAPSPEVADARVERTTLASENKPMIKQMLWLKIHGLHPYTLCDFRGVFWTLASIPLNLGILMGFLDN